MKHPTELTTTTPSEEMGRQIMALRYDLLLPILNGMIEECERQRINDYTKKSLTLCRKLGNLRYTLEDVRHQTFGIVALCRPYIDQEKKDET